MTAALEGGEWSAARPGRTYPWERPDTHCTGGWVGTRAGLDGRKFSSPSSRTVQVELVVLVVFVLVTVVVLLVVEVVAVVVVLVVVVVVIVVVVVAVLVTVIQQP